MYSGRHYGIETAFEQYEEETGVNVEFLTGNDAELRERIAAEGDETEADVYLTVDAGNLWRAAEDDLFQPSTRRPSTRRSRPELRDSEDRWFGLAVRTRTIVYNTELVDLADVPTTYEELAEPEYKGRLCLRNSSEDYQQSLVASMIAADGEERHARGAARLGRQRRHLRQRHRRCSRRWPPAPARSASSTTTTWRGCSRRSPTCRSVWSGPSRTARGVHVNVSGGGITKYAHNIDLGSSSSSGWRPTARTRWSPTTTSTRPTRRSRPSRLIRETFGTDFKRDPLHADVLGLVQPRSGALMDEAGFG